MGVDMSDNPPTRDLFPSPALSLSLAGIFRDHHANAAAVAARRAGSMEVEEGDEGSGGGGGVGSSKGGRSREETTPVEISSENSGAVRSRSEDDEFNEDLDDNDEDIDGSGGSKKKKRKKYHRHTADQIREMEALFKESPHPDEKQRQQLSKQLGLHPRQVKFWFQNRRTQIKAIQERHENSLLKTEIEQLKEENKSLRDTIHKSACPNCGFSTTSDSSKHPSSSTPSNNIIPTQQQHLKIENARLKAEVEKLKQIIGKNQPGGTTPSTTATTSPTSSSPPGNAAPGGTDQDNRSSLDLYTGIFGIEKSKIMDIANSALEELKKMATTNAPLWIKSLETGREILNYDEYVKEFQVGISSSSSNTASGAGRPKRAIEASRETGVVFIDLSKLVQSFMDVNQWKEMFPCLISKAATVDVICNGEGPNKDGATQLMFAELQMLTPMVPTREVYFIRYCKQLSTEAWAIVDVSIPKVDDNIDAASLIKCRKRASGCIIEDKSNGHCKVTWVEHLECQKTTLHSMYRSIVNSGLAFGARHWMTTLQLQCERLVFFMATNVPTKDSSGVATLAGRKSILKLAQRMTWSFCRAIGASSYNTWTKVTSKTGEDIRVASRKNLNDTAEPIGLILTAVSSVWLPVSPNVLFDFLRDHSRRHEWDVVIANGGPVQSIANLAKGQDRGNAVTIQTTKPKDGINTWVLQDSSTNAYESTVIYAPVDIPGMQSVMTGCDSSNLAILPSGFSILPDGMESRPMVISSREEERNSSEGGSLLTIALQVVTAINATSPSNKITTESMEPVKALISCILENIKTSLQCEDG